MTSKTVYNLHHFRQQFVSPRYRHPTIFSYLVGMVVLFITVIAQQLLPFNLTDHIHFSLLIASIVITTLYGGFGPGLVITFLATFCGRYFFQEPYYRLYTHNAGDIFQLVLFFLEGFLLSGVIEWLQIRYFRAERRAFHDSLTGLPNRAFFEQVFQTLSEHARLRHERLAVILFDLDHFKEINDTYGHEAGDVMLEAFARRLQLAIRKEDMAARLAGDEFIVLLGSTTNKRHAQYVAHKVIASLRHTVKFEKQRLHLEASYGIAIYPTDGDTRSSLVKYADNQLYKAKNRKPRL